MVITRHVGASEVRTEVSFPGRSRVHFRVTAAAGTPSRHFEANTPVALGSHQLSVLDVKHFQDIGGIA